MSVRGKIQSHIHTHTHKAGRKEREDKGREGGLDCGRVGETRIMGERRGGKSGKAEMEKVRQNISGEGGKSRRGRKRWKAHAVIWASGTVEER